jgi:hypothetical protein
MQQGRFEIASALTSRAHTTMFKQFLTLAVALVLLASAIGAETSAPLFPTQSEAMSADAATSSTTPELVEVP